MERDYADILNGSYGDEVVAPVTGLSYIFGSGVRLLDDSESRTERRVAVYPCESDVQSSEIAQGLMCALTWTLNALEGVTAIPVLIRTPSVIWSPDDSSFTPDTYSLDALGEDTVLTATLNRELERLTLTINATTDVESIEDLSVVLQGADEAALLSSLLDAVSQIGVWLDADANDTAGVGEVHGSSGLVREWLSAVFAWHRSTLYDAAMDKPLDIESSALRYLTVESARAEITGLTVRGIALVMSWFKKVDAAALVNGIKSLPHWQGAAGALARALIELRETRLALETLETAVEAAPEIPLNWLVLARLYTAAQQPDMAIEALQDAIEQHQTYVPLLMQYGDVLLSHADDKYSLGEVIFIDEGLDPAAAFEGIAAYEEAVRFLSGEQQAMAYVQLIGALTRYSPDNVWPAFDKLATSDEIGTYSELALNAVAAQDDIENALVSLEKATRAFPNSSRAWRNLAYAQYLIGDADGALASVEQALARITDPKSEGELELMALYAQDNTVEGRLAEIADGLSSGSRMTDQTLELLEWIVDEAPHYIEGYLLLGRAYVANGEGETALEVLLDAENNLSADADILVAIIDLLMDSGEDSVALDYVTKGIEMFPRHIPLLARAALVTDALGDREGAKAFLRQAHNIVPYHGEIMRVTRQFRDSEPD